LAALRRDLARLPSEARTSEGPGNWQAYGFGAAFDLKP
jgi:hypothetical protein